ncbi:MAG: AAA family ATPase [Bacteroides sp.]|nr:AAA family ATPase [Bacteroides sp.]
MRQIRLLSLTLVNFKGVREFHADFTNAVTLVSGDNGTGKTTLYDAYSWLLFAKDSSWRKDFNVKTLDENGKPIYRLEHSVTGVFEVNGRVVKLQRCLVEKWNKTNGSTEETMKDETQCYINDVRCGTVKEFEAEVNDIIPTDVFRLITNPYMFPRLKDDEQKEILFEIAGSINDEDVANLNPEFIALLDHINGTSLATYAKEVAAKKKKCNDSLETIPASIEATQKILAECEDDDWDAIEQELATKKESLAKIDAQLSDVNAAANAINERKVQINREIGSKRIALSNRQTTLKVQANADRNKALGDLQALESELATNERNITTKRNELASTKTSIITLDKEVIELRERFKAIANETFVMPDKESLVCPTCHEPLRGENLTKQIEMLRGNFEQHKAKRQKEIQALGVPKGQALKDAQAAETRLTGQISTLEDVMLELKGCIELKKAHIPAALNVDELIAKDEECIKLTNDITELENTLKANEVSGADTTELQETKAMLSESIAELNRLLGQREIVQRCKKEIAELEEKRIANNQALANLEQWEDVYTRFRKAKDEMLYQRINGLFSYVSFSFIKEQKNGGEKITCVCTVDGTPYPDVNAAGKLNAGLDIINALCKAKGFSAPIFIDNRESVNEAIPTISQVINLKVSRDKTLTIQ